MALKEIDTILLKVKTGIDQFSKNIYAEEVEVIGRWNDEQKLVKDEKGLEFVSKSTIYYIDPVKFSIGDSVKLDGSSDSFRIIRAIEKYRNGSGTKNFNIAYLDNGTR
jgi:hypothetical protein